MLEEELEIPLSLNPLEQKALKKKSFFFPLNVHHHQPDQILLGLLPPDEMPLGANVLVLARIFYSVLHIYDKVDKCFRLMAEEVQQVAEAAVLRYHQDRSWRDNDTDETHDAEERLFPSVFVNRCSGQPP